MGRQLKTLSQQINETAVKQLSKIWGGRLPTWDEFKQASKADRVQVNKSLANSLIFARGVPRAHSIMFGVIMLWAGFLASPIAIGLYFFNVLQGWWIVGSFVVAWYLFKVARDGQCDGLRYGAEADEAFYNALVGRGAFLFGPSAEARK